MKTWLASWRRSRLAKSDVALEFWNEDHPRWDKLKALSAKLGDSRYVFYDEDPYPFYACVALTGENQIIGYHVFLIQPIGPEMETSELTDRNGATLMEAKIRGLNVLKPWRNRGIGTSLQALTLEKAAELQVFQVRSYSDRSRVENYTVKFKLGFGYHPTLRRYKDGTTVEGVYWVKRV